MPIPENSLVSHSESHWTSTESLVSFVWCTDHRVDVDPVSRVLLLDVATVHTSKEVLCSLKSDFGQVHLVFVLPAWRHTPNHSTAGWWRCWSPWRFANKMSISTGSCSRETSTTGSTCACPRWRAHCLVEIHGFEDHGKGVAFRRRVAGLVAWDRQVGRRVTPALGRIMNSELCSAPCASPRTELEQRRRGRKAQWQRTGNEAKMHMSRANRATVVGVQGRRRLRRRERAARRGRPVEEDHPIDEDAPPTAGKSDVVLNACATAHRHSHPASSGWGFTKCRETSTFVWFA